MRHLKRLIAFVILLIPGVIATYGIKLMRDMLFGIHHSPYPALWMQSIIGLLLTIAGISFIGGFILHRDRKRNKVQNRFNKL